MLSGYLQESFCESHSLLLGLLADDYSSFFCTVSSFLKKGLFVSIANSTPLSILSAMKMLLFEMLM